MSAPLAVGDVAGQVEGDDLVHVMRCCDEDRGMCGVDLTATPVVSDDEPTTCVVCADLDDADYAAYLRGLPCLCEVPS